MNFEFTCANYSSSVSSCLNSFNHADSFFYFLRYVSVNENTCNPLLGRLRPNVKKNDKLQLLSVVINIASFKEERIVSKTFY